MTPTKDETSAPDTQDQQRAQDTPIDDEEASELTFSDAVRVDAGREELWETISDPDTLTNCVPGAESIDRVSERKYTVEITRGVSHLTVSLSGEAEFVEMNPPDYVVTRASAFDSKTGSDFDILAAMEIQATDDGAAQLVYTAEVTYTGGVANISNRVLRPIVKRDIDAYFENVRSEVEGGG
jgi:carbon monoxide dehydrogenase subunit G